MSKPILSSLSVAVLAGGAMLALELSPASAFTLSGTSVQLVTSGCSSTRYIIEPTAAVIAAVIAADTAAVITAVMHIAVATVITAATHIAVATVITGGLWRLPSLWIRRRGGGRRGGGRRSGCRTPLLDQ